MTDYTPTGKPDDVTRYDARAIRREFALIAEGVNSKANVGASSTTSTTSMLIESPATKSFVVELGKEFAPGQTVFIADLTAPASNNMAGVLISYDSTTTGIMTVLVGSHNGSGTKASWSIGVSNQSGVTLVSNTFSGHQDFARATVASHATAADIWNAAGNQIDFTGTAAVTDFPDAPQAGVERVLICAGACSFTASAGMKIDGLASGGVLSCAADDIVVVRSVSTTEFRVSVVRYSGSNGGADITTGAVDVLLTTASGRLQDINMTAPDKSVLLPNASTVGVGSSLYSIRNSGVYPFNIKDSGGAFLRRLNPGQTTDIGRTGSNWWLFGEVLEDIYRGNNSEVLNAVDSRELAVAPLSTTKAVCAFRDNTTGFLNAVVLNFGAASGTPITVNAESSAFISIAALTASKVVVSYSAGGVKKGYVLDISGNTVTPGPVATLDATASGNGNSLTTLSSTQLLFGWLRVTTGTPRERVLTVSGNVISMGVDTSADTQPDGGDRMIVSAVSPSKVLYSFRGGSPGYVLYARLQSISGTTPAPTGSILTFTQTSQSYSSSSKHAVAVLGTTRALVVQEASNYGSIMVSLLDVSGVSPVVICNKFVPTMGTSGAMIGDAVKLDSNRVYVNLTGGGSLGMDAFIVTVTGDDKLLIGPLTEGVELKVISSQQYVACAMLDSAHVMNVCRNSSTYLSAKVTEIAS